MTKINTVEEAAIKLAEVERIEVEFYRGEKYYQVIHSDGYFNLLTLDQLVERYQSLDVLAELYLKLSMEQRVGIETRLKMYLFKPGAFENLGQYTIQQAALIATARAFETIGGDA